MSYSQLTQQHKLINQFLLTKGCVTQQELEDEYKAICDVYPGRIRTRPNKSQLQQILDDIRRFMQFMNATIVQFDYEINATRYYAYQLATDHMTQNDLITKQSMNLPLIQLKLFRKIIDLSLLNGGLITNEAIKNLNISLKEKDNKIIIDNIKLNKLIKFLCESRYLYKLSNDEENDNNDRDNDDDDDIVYCLGPRSIVGLSVYINKFSELHNELKSCPICFDTIIGYGFQCPYKDCGSGYFHVNLVSADTIW